VAENGEGLGEGPTRFITDSSGERYRAVVRDLEDGYELRLEDGRTLRVPVGMLEMTTTDDYRLHESFATLSSGEYSADRYIAGHSAEPRTVRQMDSQVVPLAAEMLNVAKRQIVRGRVVVHKRVVTQQATVDELLKDEQVEINRVPVNKIVEAAEPNRTDGDILIIPLYEEVLVVEKRLVLVEELHIIKRVREHRKPQQVTLRREEASIERRDGEDDVM